MKCSWSGSWRLDEVIANHRYIVSPWRNISGLERNATEIAEYFIITCWGLINVGDSTLHAWFEAASWEHGSRTPGFLCFVSSSCFVNPGSAPLSGTNNCRKTVRQLWNHRRRSVPVASWCLEKSGSETLFFRVCQRLVTFRDLRMLYCNFSSTRSKCDVRWWNNSFYKYRGR